MNAKKIEESKPRRNIFRAFVGFFGSLKQEFKQITWTSRRELRKLTKIVLVSTFVVGLLIYVVDICIQKFLTVIHFLIQRIFG